MTTPSPSDGTTVVLITTYIEPEQVERIRAVDDRLDVQFAPELIPAPRYAADHSGAPFSRTDEEEVRWRRMLSGADVLYDFDRALAADLPELAPQVQWIQATSAGIGQFVKRMKYAERMPHTVLTTASGVHARPLGEFCALSILAFARDLPTMMRQQREKRWERFAGTDLEGKTALIFGLGAVGLGAARLVGGLGLETIGVKRTVREDDPARGAVDELHSGPALPELLPRADFLILAAPHTPETEHVIGKAELALLKPGAVIINVGRGELIDERAMIRALESGELGGAALDVFEEEPLPQDSPLWTMPNVLISPHSASTSDRENERIVDLFCENLRRFLAGEDLLNVLNAERLY